MMNLQNILTQYGDKDIVNSMDETKYIQYEMPNGLGAVEVVVKDETLWCTQKVMAQIFGVGVPAISKHLKNIYAEGELTADTTISKMETVVNRGVRGYVNEMIDFYSLDAIIAVGYRVSSLKATRFRQWATKILNEYIKKGFAMDDDRLKRLGGGGYWKELLARIRDIRSTEKVFYRQVLEIYATSIDYDPKASVSQEFFKKVQNKIHYAIHGNTAAELIVQRADAEQDYLDTIRYVNNLNRKNK